MRRMRMPEVQAEKPVTVKWACGHTTTWYPREGDTAHIEANVRHAAQHQCFACHASTREEAGR